MDPSLSSLQSSEVESILTIGFYNQYLVHNRKLTRLTLTRQHSGRPVGSIPHVTGVTPSKISKLKPKPKQLGFPTRTISGELTGCTPTKLVVNSEPSLDNRNQLYGIDIRLIGNESKEVLRFKLQLLEGANAGLPHSQGSDRSY